MLRLNDVVRFLARREEDKVTRPPRFDDEEQDRQCLDAIYISRESAKEREVMVRKVASKFVAMVKSIRSAQGLAKLYLAESGMLSAYYDSMFALRKDGCVFRGFDSVSQLFQTRPTFDISHTFAIQLTPQFLARQSRTKQDLLLFSPVQPERKIGRA